jgi:hypothetical protein
MDSVSIYRFDKSPQIVPILSELNPVHILPYDFFKIDFNINLPSTLKSFKMSLPLSFTNKNPVYIFHISHACYMPQPSHTPWFNHPNNIFWRVQIINLLIVHLSYVSYHFCLLGLNNVLILCSKITSMCGFPLGWEIKFCSHTKQR